MNEIKDFLLIINRQYYCYSSDTRGFDTGKLYSYMGSEYKKSTNLIHHWFKCDDGTGEIFKGHYCLGFIFENYKYIFRPISLYKKKHPKWF